VKNVPYVSFPFRYTETSPNLYPQVFSVRKESTSQLFPQQFSLTYDLLPLGDQQWILPTPNFTPEEYDASQKHPTVTLDEIIVSTEYGEKRIFAAFAYYPLLESYIRNFSVFTFELYPIIHAKREGDSLILHTLYIFPNPFGRSLVDIPPPRVSSAEENWVGFARFPKDTEFQKGRVNEDTDLLFQPALVWKTQVRPLKEQVSIEIALGEPPYNLSLTWRVNMTHPRLADGCTLPYTKKVLTEKRKRLKKIPLLTYPHLREVLLTNRVDSFEWQFVRAALLPADLL